MRISERLMRGGVNEVELIQLSNEDKDFYLLARSVKENLQKDTPEIVLDRFHTLMVKYMRSLCDKHSIIYDKKTPLQSLYGGYVKHLKQTEKFESQMTERILKSSISILDAFNKVRNEQSFAHDNPILNYHESVLICNNIINFIGFIESLENPQKSDLSEKSNEEEWDNIPF